MCRRVRCARCGRPSYAGCGAHVEQVLGDVPPAERCHCREREQANNATGAEAGEDERPAALLSVELDMSIVRGVDQDATKRRLGEAMKGLCDQLGMLIVAEGVETPRERDTLLRAGFDLVQGYLFAKPGPAFPAATFASDEATEGAQRDEEQHTLEILRPCSHAY